MVEKKQKCDILFLSGKKNKDDGRGGGKKEGKGEEEGKGRKLQIIELLIHIKYILKYRCRVKRNVAGSACCLLDQKIPWNSFI